MSLIRREIPALVVYFFGSALRGAYAAFNRGDINAPLEPLNNHIECSAPAVDHSLAPLGERVAIPQPRPDGVSGSRESRVAQTSFLKSAASRFPAEQAASFHGLSTEVSPRNANFVSARCYLVPAPELGSWLLGP